MREKSDLLNNTQQETAHPVNFISNFWAGPPNGCPSEDLTTLIVEPVINVHTMLTDSAHKKPSPIDKFLVGRKKTYWYTEDDYL